MLELKNISAGYGKKNVLDGVCVSFEKGKLSSVIGENGCGKSTLLRAMLGILPIESGQIVVDGRDLHSMSRGEIAKKIAYLAQGKSTPDMTVEQMVLHGRFPYLSYPRRYTSTDREIAKEAMRTVGVEGLADQPLSALSGGMRQSAYIAMALAQDTDYIFLDEPTTYLDTRQKLQTMKLLRRLADEGKGIVSVMHDLVLAFDFSDEIAVMRDGKIAEIARPAVVSASPVIGEIFGVKMEARENGNFYYHYE